MAKTNVTERLVSTLKASQMLVDEKVDAIVLTDLQIQREFEAREALDKSIMAERQRELNDMFPNRQNGNLYQTHEVHISFDF